ncbi:MAG: hypothetical protein RR441_09375 [Longicatena sp.]
MYQIQKVSNFQIQEAQKEINSEIMLAGFQLSDEDCKQLYETVKKACHTYDMVESDPMIFFSICSMVL